MGGKAATQASNVGVVLWGGGGGKAATQASNVGVVQYGIGGGGEVKLLHMPLM